MTNKKESYIKLVLFDVDETLGALILTDSEAAAKCWHALHSYFSSRKLPIPAEVTEPFMKVYFPSDEKGLRKIHYLDDSKEKEVIQSSLAAMHNVLENFSSEDRKNFRSEFGKLMNENPHPPFIPAPGASECLRKLQEMGIKIGFITKDNLFNTRKKLQTLGLSDERIAEIDREGLLYTRSEIEAANPSLSLPEAQKTPCIRAAIANAGTEPSKVFFVGNEAYEAVNALQEIGCGFFAVGPESSAGIEVASDHTNHTLAYIERGKIIQDFSEVSAIIEKIDRYKQQHTASKRSR